MPSDSARRSFDATRMYRSVVAQQGRVTLEADTNEAEEIRLAESRAELIDIIGPTGTPDEGFKISTPGNGTAFDFAIGQGTLYLGGVRVQSAPGLTYLTQQGSEWADYAATPSEIPAGKSPVKEIAYLRVEEQEVSAVEDPALREVALGGPDTAARRRMVQRVHRALMDGANCEEAMKTAVKKVSPALSFDPATTALISSAGLKVDFIPGAVTPPDPCQPTAKDGFLGADNQLIRVQTSDATHLLWGFDNASFLYRATVKSATTLQLESAPVDVYHNPANKQWAELLGTAVLLDPAASVAAAVGEAQAIAGYDIDGKIITLQSALVKTPVGARVFVRIWEGRVAFAGNPQIATDLVDHLGASTGLRIFTKGFTEPGDFWMIGVRPTTPDAIYPARLHAGFQPPDGPHRWATPLAEIAWKADLKSATIHDCRKPFDDLVELTKQKCCELKVSPGDDLQNVIAGRIELNASLGVYGLHVRFSNGVFRLDRPLVLKAPDVGGDLTVSGCGLGTRIVATTQETALVLYKWTTASVSDLSVEAVIADRGYSKKRPRPDSVPPEDADEFRHLGGALTLLRCKSASVERVVAGCGHGRRRAATCVTIRNNDDVPGDARVRSCDLRVGMRQTGVLLVNIRRATVDDNSVQLAPRTASIDGAILLGSLLGKELKVARALDAATGKDNGATWLGTILPIEGAENGRRAKRSVAAVVAQVMKGEAGPLDAAQIASMKEWLAGQKALVAGGQGIVVGGSVAQDVRILHNTIVQTAEGVRVGLSARGRRSDHVFADRVQIVGNTITTRLPEYERGAHAGIFVGNANCTTIRDNRVAGEEIRRMVSTTLQKTYEKYARAGNESSAIDWRKFYAWLGDGIRVWGVPGPMLLVSGNSTQHVDVGIRIVQVGDRPAVCLCEVTQNVAFDVLTAIQQHGTVTVAADNVSA